MSEEEPGAREDDTERPRREDDTERQRGADATLDDPRFREGDAERPRRESDADGADPDEGDESGGDGGTASTESADGAADDPDPVELGVALVERIEDDELSMAELMDRVETVSTHPRIVSEIIDAAEERGLVERDGATVRPQGGGYVRFGADVITKEGEFSCRRCGTGLSEGYFIDLDAGEVGPFGSSCIRKVTGRE
ncbi:DUF5830 family protein [Halarchaeum sp. CBA1220]|uniref:DUF5830 family protein n=1 Tax=Halarchaeum sp. CBA1220 TaxID=1853682 RepID=UPI0026BBCFAF